MPTNPPPSIPPNSPQGMAGFWGAAPFYLPVLLTDGDDVVSRQCFVQTNIGYLQRGLIVHRDPTTGNVVASDGNPAGTIPPNFVLAHDIDSTVTPIPSGGFQGLGYVHAKLAYSGVVWCTGTKSVIADYLRTQGIYIETIESATPGQIVPLGSTDVKDMTVSASQPDGPPPDKDAKSNDKTPTHQSGPTHHSKA